MPLTIRNKMILYTVLPVMAVYLILFVVGVAHMKGHLSRVAQDLLAEHARHQASRLGLLMAQIPALAETIGDQALADPAPSRALLYAHLMDGLRLTPGARTVAVELGNPARSALMERGAAAARPLRDGESLRRPPGWHIVEGDLGLSRPIYRAGRRLGDSWVTLSIAEIYEQIAQQSPPGVDVILRRADGTVLKPVSAPALPLQRLPKLLPFIDSQHTRPGELRHAGASFWLQHAPVPGHPWWVIAVIPVATALAELRHELRLFAAGLLLSLLLIGAAARTVTRPLKTLDTAVRRITAGDFIVSPTVSSDDELSRLAKAIGRMARHIADRENQLRSSHQVLEQRVSERTAALQESNFRLTRQIQQTRNTQEALRLANEQAQQANRAKSEFLSNMSHELRTPLHGVLGYAQILRRDPLINSAQGESLDAIERCGQHLLTLINDILDLTKIEAGEMRVDRQPTALAQLIGDACTIVAQRARQKGLDLRSELADDLPVAILTDPLKLRQILLNLLGNAVKFTTSGSVILAVEQHDDGQLSFEVTDSGVGIPDDKLDAIFDAFQQAREGQAVDGTGLGLAISQRLIRLLGGQQLGVESTPGKGSRFYFCLPCEEADAKAMQLRRGHTTPPGPLHLAPGQTCNVIVVDELTENREVLSTLLGDVGCDVDTFSDRTLAAQRLREKAYDLLLIDVRLPNAELAAITTELRCGETGGRPALVAVSANVFDDTRQQVEMAGFDGFLAKPFSALEVAELIRSSTSVHLIGGPAEEKPDGATWPPSLARSTSVRIRQAVEMGDIGSLFQLAEDLADEPGAPQTDVEHMALMARMFDFDGLRHLSERLQPRREGNTG